MTYIENNYDTDYLERVYISGDGANWIKTGLEWFIKSVYVLLSEEKEKTTRERKED